jgi:tRNA 2-thiocytidine biosynthesis protein TtcA
MSQLIPLRVARRRPERPRSAEEILVQVRRKVGQAMRDFPMIEDGDRLMVCVSGGKDSYALLEVLVSLQRRSPVSYELIAVNIDQGWPGYDTAAIEAHVAGLGVDYRMIQESYAELVEERLKPGQTPCSLCSRFRRGVLYNLAEELGCSKIALGHHRDDLVETLLLNLFYSGRLASMPPVLRSDDGRNTVIRPLAYVPEELLVELAEAREFPVVRCGCPSCGLPEQKRQVVKQLLNALSEDTPDLRNHMLAALGNVAPSHLLDPNLARISAKDSRGRAF